MALAISKNALTMSAAEEHARRLLKTVGGNVRWYPEQMLLAVRGNRKSVLGVLTKAGLIARITGSDKGGKLMVRIVGTADGYEAPTKSSGSNGTSSPRPKSVGGPKIGGISAARVKEMLQLWDSGRGGELKENHQRFFTKSIQSIREQVAKAA